MIDRATLKSAVNLIVHMMHVLSSEKRWSSYYAATDKHGNLVHSFSADAEAWSINGALTLATLHYANEEKADTLERAAAYVRYSLCRVGEMHTQIAAVDPYETALVIYNCSRWTKYADVWTLLETTRDQIFAAYDSSAYMTFDHATQQVQM